MRLLPQPSAACQNGGTTRGGGLYSVKTPFLSPVSGGPPGHTSPVHTYYLEAVQSSGFKVQQGAPGPTLAEVSEPAF